MSCYRKEMTSGLVYLLSQERFCNSRWQGLEEDVERWGETEETRMQRFWVSSLRPFPFSEYPKGAKLIPLKALKMPQRIFAWLCNKYQDSSWIVFKLNAICQSGEPSFHLFFSLDLHFHSMPASFCFQQIGICKRLFGSKVGKKRSLP